MGGIQPSVPGPDKGGILHPRLPQDADRPRSLGRRSSPPMPPAAEAEPSHPRRRNLLEEMPRGLGEEENGALEETRSRETAARRAISRARRHLPETGSGTDPWADWRRTRAERHATAAQPLSDADPAYPGRPQRPAPARPATTGPKPGETQVAFAPLVIQGITRFGPPAIAGLQYLWQKHLERQSRADAPAAPPKPTTPPPSRMQAHEPPSPTGGGKEPPERPDTTRESFPAEERGPTLHVSPEPATGKPAIEVFPDISDELERWLVSESRGKKDGQQKDTQFLIDHIYKGLAKRGQKREHTHGGDHPDRKEYLKERYIWGKDRQRRGSRRSDAAFEIGEGKDKEILDLNVTDTRADRRTRTTREQIAFEAIKALKKRWKQKGDTITAYKSKGWIEKEWQDAARRDIDAYLDAKYGPPRGE